jgi:LPXTG-site transpeptidase (sortase) family protein
MKRKKLFIFLSIIVIAAIGGVAVWKIKTTKKPQVATLSIKAVSKEVPTTKSTAPDNSDHVVIEKIGVNAKILNVGLTKEGNMEAPANIYDAGWYKNSAKFGQKGTSVLAGHLNGALKEEGVFFKLDKLQAGDLITIRKNDGTKYTYKVSKTQKYDSTARPSEVFTSTSGTHLNLITCTGPWNSDKSQYDQRLVVFTNLVK